MRRLVALGSIVILMGTLSWADTTPPPPPPAPGTNNGAGQPCKQIEQACSSAGFVVGQAPQGNGLFKDCMQPVLKGQAVKGVSVDPTVVTACKERLAKRRAHRHGGQGGPGGQSGQGGQGSGNTGGGPGSNSGAGSKDDSDNSSDQ